MTIKSSFLSIFTRTKAPSSVSGRAQTPAAKKIGRLPKILWIALPLILIAAGGFAYYKAVYLPAQASTAEPAMQTATVRQGDLVIYASGTGTLISADQTDLAFSTGGEVKKIYVEVGETVKTGDLLAEVDDTSAQIAYQQARRALMELTSGSAIAEAQTSLASSAADIDTAKGHLEYVLGPNIIYWEGQVADAEAGVEDAQAAVDKAPPDKDSQAALEKAKAALTYIQSRLDGAWISYKATYVPNHFTVTDRATGKKYVAAPSEADILSARAELATAQSAYQEAQWLYAALTGRDVPEDATGSGLSELETAKLDLQSAQQTLDGTKLYAPIDGTVMTIDTSVGDTASGGSAVVTVADLTHPYLDLYLDESDWANIQTGYDVEVTFDILPDVTYTGKVTQVDPGLYSDNGSSAVHAVVQLTNIDASKFNLPLGTTATVDVIGGRADNAVLVPIEALHQAGDQYTVFVVENGTPRLRVVEVGLQDSLYAQITSGLEPGEVVTTGITETK